MPWGALPELSLPKRKVLGPTCGCSPRSSNVVACRSLATVIGIECFGQTESPGIDEQLFLHAADLGSHIGDTKKLNGNK
jgi:hypothetical protein